MSEYRTRIKRKVCRLATLLLARILPRLASSDKLDKWLVLLTRLAAAVPSEAGHAAQVRDLHEALKKNHPAIKLARRAVRELHPKFFECIVANLWIPWWLNGKARREFEQREGFEPPNLAVISPIKACNLRCTGCYANAVSGNQGERLDFETIDRVIHELKSLGTNFIVFSGGEPMHGLMWPTIKRVCREHRDLAFMMYTNGTLIDDKKVADLLELGNLSPAISVEGWQEETDERRGKGVYAKVMAAMDRLREAGVLFGFSLTYTSKNFDVATSPRFIDHLMQKGCLYGWYFMYVPIGKDPDTSLIVSPRQRDAIRQFTWDMLREKGLFIADFWNSGHMTRGCLAGGRYLHINHKGDIEPCVFFKFSTHNVRDTKLIDALRSPLFAEMRNGQQKQRNPLTPCQFMDHPDCGHRAVAASGAKPTEEGGEALFHPKMKAWLKHWAAEYREEYADPAWTQTSDYAYFIPCYESPRWLLPATGRLTRLPDEETVLPREASRL